MLGNLLAFLVVGIVVIVTPGPDTALTIRNALIGGRRGGIFTALGIALGQATWTLATSAGVAALVAASKPVYRGIKFVGAAYLVFLGAQAFYGSLRDRASAPGSVDLGPTLPRLETSAALRQGLISNLTNPKMAAFFPALLPQFVPAGEAGLFGLLLLGLLFASMTLAWLTGYAFAVDKLGDFLRRPRIRRLLEAATGSVLIVLGLRLATEHR